MAFRRSVLLGSLALAACAAAASKDTAGALGAEEALPGAFGNIVSAVEFADGRVAFTDSKAKLVHIGDFATGAVTALGTRQDSLKADAPADRYNFPGTLVHLAGDTIAVVDYAAIRTTLWGEDGTARGARVFAPIGGMTPVLNYDHQGYGYKVDYTAILGGSEPGTPVRPDSTPVLRLRAGEAKADTVAKLSAPQYGTAMFGAQSQEVPIVFAPNDYTGVLPDGSVWVARGKQNRVDWRAPDGTWTVGTTRDYAKVPVTDEDKARVLEQLKARGMNDKIAISFPFAESRPPFESAYGRADGTVWLQRPRATPAAPYVFDVWGRDGRWQREVALPTDVILVGFGKAHLYGARKDGEGRRLVRFTLAQ